MPNPPVALITASTAGLGAATAKVFAVAGYRIAINYHQNPHRATALLSTLQSLSPLHPSPTNFISIQADLSSRIDITRLVTEAATTFGGLDVVFSNGGWTTMTDFGDLDANVDEEVWDRCWNLNVKSHLWVCVAARRWLEEGEGGCFVSTASLAGVRPSGSSVAYSVTKAAQIHLIKSLATMVGPKIRVNSVSPGILLTDWGLKFPQEKLNAALAKTQLNRFATVEDVAEQVLCFAKSKSVTGANAIIDAGWSL